ncbi:hypothetical protein [Peijinzhouia sedimentorum]
MTRNYPQFYAICKSLGLDKDELVHAATAGGSSRLRDLTDAEFADLLEQLKGMQKSSKKPNESIPPGDRQRKKLISIAHQMNWPNPVENVKAWAMKQKYKKPLMLHDVSELNVLVTIMEERVYKSYLRDLNSK